LRSSSIANFRYTPMVMKIFQFEYFEVVFD
jgi:hypothetical protein